MFGPMVVLLLAAQAGSPARAGISSTEAARMEASLKANPRQNSVRSALLEYYFRAPIAPAAAIPERRRHILWIIENAPDEDIAYGPLVTIDAAGHRLADPPGFKLASAAWRAQAGKPSVKPMTLANAAYFFKLADRPYAIGLLKQALSLDPRNKEIAARLGDEYALLILGVTMINGSSYPVRNDPALAQSAMGRQAREELAASSNPYLVSKAGYQLLWQGDVLYYSGRLPFDPQPLALATLDRAVSLAPDDAGVAALRAQYDKFQIEKDKRPPAPAAGAAKTVPAPPVDPPATPPAPEAAPVPAPHPLPPPMTADVVRKIAVGMTREDVLKLAPPATRISMENDDGDTIEVFEYSANGKRLGSVQLKDGTVSRVQIR